MEKLRLKNSTLRVKKRKLQVQLKQKEEAGEVRHEVDFDQLKIENKQFNEQFEEKNQELLKLKLSAGNTLQVLNSHKVGQTMYIVALLLLMDGTWFPICILGLGLVYEHSVDELSCISLS